MADLYQSAHSDGLAVPLDRYRPPSPPVYQPPAFHDHLERDTSLKSVLIDSSVIATDNTQKIAKREVSEQLGGSDYKPVILTLAKQVNTSAGKMPPAGTTRRQTGRDSGNSLTSTSNR